MTCDNDNQNHNTHFIRNGLIFAAIWMSLPPWAKRATVICFLILDLLFLSLIIAVVFSH